MECCQICHVRVTPGESVCIECAQLSELSRHVVKDLVQTLNPVWRGKLVSVLLADRDHVLAALLRG